MSIVWRLTVQLRDVYPEVWRTILVRPATKLAMLHRYLQAAMGWDDYRLFCFTIAQREYLIPHKDLDVRVKTYDPRRYTLERLFPKLPVNFRYLYDFGDHWEHDVTISGMEEAVYRKQYPICIDGRRQLPAGRLRRSTGVPHDAVPRRLAAAGLLPLVFRADSNLGAPRRTTGRAVVATRAHLGRR